AITVGNTGTPDPIRLVKFTNGISTTSPSTILTTSLQDTATDYWSVKVTYDPASNTWELFTRDDGNVAFADPTSAGGFTTAGAAVDTTYTSVPLTHSGVLWASATAANQVPRYDNL